MFNEMPPQASQNDKKIDYTSFEPINHKKTLTLINYFILNTSQFLNAFSNVSEKKIHDIDEKLDELESLIAIFESKMDSLPEEAFMHQPSQVENEEGVDGLGIATSNIPDLVMTDTMNP